MEPLLGQIIMFGGNFAPRGWAFCDGQLLPIAQNTALSSILGTTYGGDGRTTFGLPDLRGRVPMGGGHGPGLSPRSLGQKGGNETTTLTVSNLPPHNHSAALHAEVLRAIQPRPNIAQRFGIQGWIFVQSIMTAYSRARRPIRNFENSGANHRLSSHCCCTRSGAAMAAGTV